MHSVELETEEFTVRERIFVIMEMLESSDGIEFNQIFERPDGRPPSRNLIVASFLAILELARLFALRIYQGLGDDSAPVGPIRLRQVEEQVDGADDWRERVAELM